MSRTNPFGGRGEVAGGSAADDLDVFSGEEPFIHLAGKNHVTFREFYRIVDIFLRRQGMDHIAYCAYPVDSIDCENSLGNVREENGDIISFFYTVFYQSRCDGMDFIHELFE